MKDAVVEALDQVWEGMDIPPAESLLKTISQEKAGMKLAHWPYSILTNVEHARFWQKVWLDRLQGRRAESFTKDWRVPYPEEWKEVRAAFLADFQAAIELARSLQHKMKSDEVARKTLLQIAIHNAYHLGQINLLKRELRLAGKQEAEDED